MEIERTPATLVKFMRSSVLPFQSLFKLCLKKNKNNFQSVHCGFIYHALIAWLIQLIDTSQCYIRVSLHCCPLYIRVSLHSCQRYIRVSLHSWQRYIRVSLHSWQCYIRVSLHSCQCYIRVSLHSWSKLKLLGVLVKQINTYTCKYLV